MCTFGGYFLSIYVQKRCLKKYVNNIVCVYNDVYNEILDVIDKKNAKFETRKNDIITLTLTIPSFDGKLTLYHKLDTKEISLFDQMNELFIDTKYADETIINKLISVLYLKYKKEIGDYIVLQEPMVIENIISKKEFEKTYTKEMQNQIINFNNLLNNPNLLKNNNLDIFSELPSQILQQQDSGETLKPKLLLDDILKKINNEDDIKKLTKEELDFLKSIK